MSGIVLGRWELRLPPTDDGQAVRRFEDWLRVTGRHRRVIWDSITTEHTERETIVRARFRP